MFVYLQKSEVRKNPSHICDLMNFNRLLDTSLEIWESNQQGFPSPRVISEYDCNRGTHLILDGLQNQMRLLELQQEFLNNLYVFRSPRLGDFAHQVSAFLASLSGGSSHLRLIHTRSRSEGN